MWEKDGKEVVFLDRVDRERERMYSVCGYFRGFWREPVAVIEEPFHMSFPMCFEWQNELYMIPETEMDQALHLYRCVEFPYKWEGAGIYMKGWSLVDSVLWSQNDGNMQFLASEYDPKMIFIPDIMHMSFQRADGQIKCRDLGRISDEYTFEIKNGGTGHRGQSAACDCSKKHARNLWLFYTILQKRRVFARQNRERDTPFRSYRYGS